MKTIIAGSRSFNDYELLCTVLSSLDWEITEVVSGTARGADQLGERWAKDHGIKIKLFPAKWDVKDPKTGFWIKDKSAGFKRNLKMAEYANALVAFWGLNPDGKRSRGTANMISHARKLGLKVKVVEI